MTSYQIMFLGTGATGGLPDIDCVTRKDGSACTTCASALAGNIKDQRRGTCVAVTATAQDNSKRTILLDLPMDFYSSACELFPRHGLSEIGGVLVTNSEEAMHGIGEISNWTLGGRKHGAIQDHVDVYLSDASLSAFEKRMPYMVDRRKSTTGYPPSLAFHGIGDYGMFEAADFKIQPLPLFAKDSAQVTALGYLIDDKIAYLNAEGLLLEDAQQALLDAKPEVVILGCSRQGSFLPSWADELDEDTRYYLVNIDHKHSHEELSSLRTAKESATVMPAFDGLLVSVL